jgi:hypothetical protein
MTFKAADSDFQGSPLSGSAPTVLPNAVPPLLDSGHFRTSTKAFPVLMGFSSHQESLTTQRCNGGFPDVDSLPQRKHAEVAQLDTFPSVREAQQADLRRASLPAATSCESDNEFASGQAEIKGRRGSCRHANMDSIAETYVPNRQQQLEAALTKIKKPLAVVTQQISLVRCESRALP